MRNPTYGAWKHAAHSALVAVAVAWAGCESRDESGAPTASRAGPTTEATAEPTTSTAPAPTVAPSEARAVEPERRCPLDMVRVARRFCVDRYEAMLVEKGTDLRISPYYAPSRKTANYVVKQWQRERLEVGDEKARAMPLPNLPAWERERDFAPRAMARKGVTPNGYVSGVEAKAACENADKRLCSGDEWRLACGGEQARKFPYGDKYEQGACNVFREAHPAMVLHDNPSKGHHDPRLNLVEVKGRPLLRKTGASPRCKSEWEADAIYDMVGNLDEWFDGDPKPGFAGGFYARSTREGCDWRTSVHPFPYSDYSTGVRCCRDLLPPGVEPATEDGNED